MNAVERIEAAIQKLEGLKGQYFIYSGWFCEEQDGEAVPLTDDEYARTLHRTIDAQLAILRHVLRHYQGDLGISTNRHVVALADAILGGAE